MAILLGFATLTLFACFLLKGVNININITHKHEQPKQPETPKYNESMVDLLPNNVKQYYHENNGRNNF
jgi:hypothetical protein